MYKTSVPDQCPFAMMRDWNDPRRTNSYYANVGLPTSLALVHRCFSRLLADKVLECLETENKESDTGEEILQHSWIASVSFRVLDTSSSIRNVML